MYPYGSLISIFCLLTFSLLGQHIKVFPEYERLYRSAEKLYSMENATERTDSIALAKYLQVIGILKEEKKYNQILVDSYLKCGILLMSRNESERALGFFRETMATVGHENQFSDSLLFKPYLFAGSVHSNLNNLDSAMYYFKRAEALNNRYTNLTESERLFNRFGALYYETGDYKKSINYFEKALSIVEEEGPQIFFLLLIIIIISLHHC